MDKTRYQYRGAVVAVLPFGERILDNSFAAETVAGSSAKAEQNMLYQFRTKNGLEMRTRLRLDRKKIKAVA